MHKTVLHLDADGFFASYRPHQGIGPWLLEYEERSKPLGGDGGKVIAFLVLGDLHHEYRWAAQLRLQERKREQMKP